MCRDREEMGAILPLDASLIDELEVRLMDQSRRREGMFSSLPPEIAPSEEAKFTIDGLNQAIPRMRGVN